jgi:E3 ubiquitin-protein ligase DOA10
MCRVCLSEEDTLENPILTPCKCSGSMKFIHVACLVSWFKSKLIQQKTSFVTTYYWQSLECELCKTIYPFEVTSQDGSTKFQVIFYDVPA